MHHHITGIQQIGIGVEDARLAALWYKKHFGMDTLVFDDIANASLMTQYTGNTMYERRAMLTMNMSGGGGFEVWQFQNRKPLPYKMQPRYGDIGIFAAKLKCADVGAAHVHFKSCGLPVSSIESDAKNDPHFLVQDAFGNYFDIVSGNHWFKKNRKKINGGVTGAVIGVSDMNAALRFYKILLPKAEIIYDVEEAAAFQENEEAVECRKVLLSLHPNGEGAFQKLLGSIELELVQRLDGKQRRIFENRFWGDCGFIHVCFDVLRMDALKSHCASKGFPFSVDSAGSFPMEDAAGRFGYVEDPDGTLIELVETHKIPILKKMGWYLNLKKRTAEKPLPDWMISMMALSKVK